MGTVIITWYGAPIPQGFVQRANGCVVTIERFLNRLGSRIGHFGEVTAEVMTCGAPATVCNSAGCLEVIGEGRGFVAEGCNVDQVFQSIQKG